MVIVAIIQSDANYYYRHHQHFGGGGRSVPSARLNGRLALSGLVSHFLHPEESPPLSSSEYCNFHATLIFPLTPPSSIHLLPRQPSREGREVFLSLNGGQRERTSLA